VVFELTLLALATAVRPTSLAAMYALLRSGSPRRFMTAYVLAGLAFTVTIGLVVVWAFQGVDITWSSSRTKAYTEILGGILCLAFGLLVLARRIGPGRGAEAPAAPPADAPAVHARRVSFERHVTLRRAALAGPATHIPGLFYVVALNLIVAQPPHKVREVAQVIGFNLIWFVLPIAALIVCVVRPQIAINGLSAIQSWTRLHARGIVLAITFGVGTVLVIRGVVAL
jgi:hypothetical protein